MVDDLSLETELNTWSRQGWHFESIQFAMRESSKRPSMAFIFFVKSTPSDEVSNESKLKGPRTSSQNARHRLLQLAGLTDQDESL